MTKRFKVGDHVSWNSEAGRVSGRIIKVHTRDVGYRGYTHHASKNDPQYAIKSDKSDHVAMGERPAAPARVTESDLPLPLFTIGHSTRQVVELADLLTAAEVGGRAGRSALAARHLAAIAERT